MASHPADVLYRPIAISDRPKPTFAHSCTFPSPHSHISFRLISPTLSPPTSFCHPSSLAPSFLQTPHYSLVSDLTSLLHCSDPPFAPHYPLVSLQAILHLSTSPKEQQTKADIEEKNKPPCVVNDIPPLSTASLPPPPSSSSSSPTAPPKQNSFGNSNTLSPGQLHITGIHRSNI
jgi:hypothetical protein